MRPASTCALRTAVALCKPARRVWQPRSSRSVRVQSCACPATPALTHEPPATRGWQPGPPAGPPAGPHEQPYLSRVSGRLQDEPCSTKQPGNALGDTRVCVGRDLQTTRPRRTPRPPRQPYGGGTWQHHYANCCQPGSITSPSCRLADTEGGPGVRHLRWHSGVSPEEPLHVHSSPTARGRPVCQTVSELHSSTSKVTSKGCCCKPAAGQGQSTGSRVRWVGAATAQAEGTGGGAAGTGV